MMYEMLYGFTPFKADVVVTTYSNIMNHKVSKKWRKKIIGKHAFWIGIKIKENLKCGDLDTSHLCFMLQREVKFC